MRRRVRRLLGGRLGGRLRRGPAVVLEPVVDPWETTAGEVMEAAEVALRLGLLRRCALHEGHEGEKNEEAARRH